MNRGLAPVLILFAIGCNRSPTEPTPVWDGFVRVAGVITSYQINAAVASATVTIGTATATTDAAGFYRLRVAPGDYYVFVDEQRISSVRLHDQTYRGDFYVDGTNCIARYGTVVDKLSRKPIAGASVGGTLTDGAGWYERRYGCGQVCQGYNTTFVTITHPAYLDARPILGRGICFVSRADYELQPR